MVAHPQPELDLRALLTAADRAAPADAVEAVAAELATTVGAREVSFLIVDFGGAAVLRFVRMKPGTSDRSVEEAGAERLLLEGTPYEEVVKTQRVVVVAEPPDWRVYAPVASRGDAIGVLELVLSKEPDAAVTDYLSAASHALAYIVIANARHTDLFERGQRHEPFSLPAEIQRRLLPLSFTCEAAQFTLAGWLEPASQIAGDTFDYSVDRDALHVSITDAVGHDLDAAFLATMLVASLRNTRRQRFSLEDQTNAANEAVIAHDDPEKFVTGLVLRIALATGEMEVVNAGHPHLFLQRGASVELAPLEREPPFGVLATPDYRAQRFALEPGDRVVLVTDGMLERNAEDLDLRDALAGMRSAHPRDVVHSLGRAVVEVAGGELKDDATVMCIDWHGGRRSP